MYGGISPERTSEDVVAGIRTPHDDRAIARLPSRLVFEQFADVAEMLEKHTATSRIEFNVERGKLWMLQTRTAKAVRQGCR